MTTASSDIGAPDAALSAALAGWAADPTPAAAARVHAALIDARLLVPVVAALLAPEDPEPGRPASEATAQMSLPTIVGRDGQVAMPAFTSLDSLNRWRAEARPVPVAGADVCRAVLTEGCSALLLDAAGPVSFALEGQPLADLAAGYVPVVAGEEATLAARTVAGGLPVVAPAVHPGPEAMDGIRAALAGEPLIAAAFLLAPAGGPSQGGLTVGLVLNDEMESSEVVVMVRRVAAALGRTPLAAGGLDLAVLTPEQQRQARALGPPAYAVTSAVGGAGQ